VDRVEALRWERRPTDLRSPVLVAAFRGWNDAGEAATFAVGYLQAALKAERFATVDPEEFFDFQSHRPRIHIENGGLKSPIGWPAIEVLETTADAERQLILVNGIEPSMRWPTFSRGILDLAAELQVELVVTFGALLADVPHTRPVRISGLSVPIDLLDPLSLRRPDYEGPTGIVGTLHAAAVDRGFRSASVWAAVPHYVGAAPSPNAALALLRATQTLTGVTVDLGDLEQAVAQFEEQVDDAVRRNPQAANLVAELERAYDREEDQSFGPLPSGDAIAAEFERFLRERGAAEGDG
jgi:predicted ATP-grasp superfamily ATP-dependent carboligase